MNARVLLFSLATSCTALAHGQENCSDLMPGTFGYCPFDSNLVEVRLLNSGPIGWSYPYLVMYNTSGDSLATAPPDLFALTDEQVFVLNVIDHTAINDGGVYPQLELYTAMDGDSLRCSWVLSGMFCYPGICSTVFPYVHNGDISEANTPYDWSVTDAGNEVVASGQLVLQPGQLEAMDTVCLPPGDYTLHMENPAVSGANAFFRMRGSAWNSPASPTVSFDSGDASSFTILAACMDDANGIQDVDADAWKIHQSGSSIRIEHANGMSVGDVELLDSTGRLLIQATGNTSTLLIPTNGFSAGVVLVRVKDQAERTFVQRIVITH